MQDMMQVQDTSVVAADHATSLVYRSTVREVIDLGPGLRRLVIGGPELEHLGLRGTDGSEGEYLDLRFKLMVPHEGASIDSIADALPALRPDAPYDADAVDGWYKEWLQLPVSVRGAMRTYTLKWVRDEQGERRAAIDLVLHGVDADGVVGDACGPAAAFAARAQVGDELVMLAPNRRLLGRDYGGIDFRPGAAENLLLVADETGAPALVSILADLPRTARGEALIEVPHAGQEQATSAPDGVRVTWLPRTPGAQVGERLLTAVPEAAQKWAGTHLTAGQDPEDVDVDAGILWETGTDAAAKDYAWIAGEAGVVKTLRRHLVRDLGVDRKRIAFMGYWRAGRAEG